MPMLRRVQFMAQITACTEKAITGKTSIYGNELPRQAARKRALAELRRVREKPGTFACLCEVGARNIDGETIYGNNPGFVDQVVEAHEGFHAEVNALKIPGMNPHWRILVEESAAYAIGDSEPGTMEVSGSRMYCAIHTVRFMVATDNPDLREMQNEAIRVLKKTGSVIAGNGIAAAFTCATDLLCYMECLGVLVHWGKRDGRRILIDAIYKGSEAGPEDARRFLLSKLTRSMRNAIESAYRIDPEILRVRSPYHEDLEHENLFLQ